LWVVAVIFVLRVAVPAADAVALTADAAVVVLSSRNARLSEDSRRQAPAIYAALQWAAAQVAAGQAREAAALRQAVTARIEEAGGRVDYVEVRLPASQCGAVDHITVFFVEPTGQDCATTG
jgi:pantothenate synthetase